MSISIPDPWTAAWNHAGKLWRSSVRSSARRVKRTRTWLTDALTGARRARDDGRDAARQAYARGVKRARAWGRWREQVWDATSLEIAVRRELHEAARGDRPIIIGPWWSEVGYEALYWVPFVRWFADYYRVPRERLVVVSRGGVAAWYADVAAGYVELLDLFSPDEVAAAAAERRAAGDQKQLGMGAFDAAIVSRVHDRLGPANICHPSTMFRLLRRFWLGTASLQHVFDHTRYRRVDADDALAPALPPSFVALKFYSGRTLPQNAAARAGVHGFLDRIRAGRPIVWLDSGVTLDEHRDYLLDGVSDVLRIEHALTPQNNLGVQTAILARAQLFAGTCGSLAWLAPLLGTPTIGLYADDHLLAPHLYAARQIYPRVGAAPFTALPIDAVATLQP